MDEKRFIIMSVVLVCTFILSPFFYQYPFAGVLLRVFFSLLMISAVYACAEKGRALIVALSLMVPAVLAEWISYFTALPELSLVGRVAAVLFLAHVIRIIVKHMIHARKVNANLIFGAISVYLLISVFWAIAYSALEVAQPESFTVKPLTVADGHAAGAGNRAPPPLHVLQPCDPDHPGLWRHRARTAFRTGRIFPRSRRRPVVPHNSRRRPRGTPCLSTATVGWMLFASV